jgi:predicted secreted acid phosphatase
MVTHHRKLALIDLDGAVIDASARFRRADDLRHAHPLPDSREAWDYYWREALDPTQCHLDTLVPGAADHLNALSREGYQVIFLSSRPSSLRQATSTWLAEHALREDALLILKVRSFQYQKSIAWYGWLAETLIDASGAREILVVSDKEQNLAAMRRVLTDSQVPGVRYFKQLSAIFDPNEGAEESRDPFNPYEGG